MKNFFGIILIDLLIGYGSADVSHLVNQNNGYLPPLPVKNLPTVKDYARQPNINQYESRGYLPPFQEQVKHNEKHIKEQHEERGYLPPPPSAPQQDASRGYLPPTEHSQSHGNEAHQEKHQKQDNRGYLPPNEDLFDLNHQVSYHNSNKISPNSNHFIDEYNKVTNSLEKYEDNSKGYNYSPPGQSFHEGHQSHHHKVAPVKENNVVNTFSSAIKNVFQNSALPSAHREHSNIQSQLNIFRSSALPSSHHEHHQNQNEQHIAIDFTQPSAPNLSSYNHVNGPNKQLNYFHTQHPTEEKDKPTARDYLPPSAPNPTTDVLGNGAAIQLNSAIKQYQSEGKDLHASRDYLPPHSSENHDHGHDSINLLNEVNSQYQSKEVEQQDTRGYLPPLSPLNHDHGHDFNNQAQNGGGIKSTSISQNYNFKAEEDKGYFPPIRALELPQSADTLHIVPPTKLGLPVEQSKNPIVENHVDVPLPIPQIGYYVIPAVVTELTRLDEGDNVAGTAQLGLNQQHQQIDGQQIYHQQQNQQQSQQNQVQQNYQQEPQLQYQSNQQQHQEQQNQLPFNDQQYQQQQQQNQVQQNYQQIQNNQQPLPQQQVQQQQRLQLDDNYHHQHIEGNQEVQQYQQQPQLQIQDVHQQQPIQQNLGNYQYQPQLQLKLQSNNYQHQQQVQQYQELQQYSQSNEQQNEQQFQQNLQQQPQLQLQNNYQQQPQQNEQRIQQYSQPQGLQVQQQQQVQQNQQHLQEHQQQLQQQQQFQPQQLPTNKLGPADFSESPLSPIRIIPSVETAKDLSSQGYSSLSKVVDQRFADIGIPPPATKHLENVQQTFPPLLQTQLNQNQQVSHNFLKDQNTHYHQDVDQHQTSFENFANTAVRGSSDAGLNNQENQINRPLESTTSNQQENAYLPPINNNVNYQQQSFEKQDQQVYSSSTPTLGTSNPLNQVTHLKSYMATVNPNDRYGSTQFEPQQAIVSNPPAVNTPIMFSKPSVVQAYAPGMAYQEPSNVPSIKPENSKYSQEIQDSPSIDFQLNQESNLNFTPQIFQHDNTVFSSDNYDEMAQILEQLEKHIRTIQITDHHDNSVKNLQLVDSSNQNGERTIEILGATNDVPKGDHNVLHVISKEPHPEPIHQTIKIFKDKKEVLPITTQTNANSYLPPLVEKKTSHRRF